MGNTLRGWRPVSLSLYLSAIAHVCLPKWQKQLRKSIMMSRARPLYREYHSNLDALSLKSVAVSLFRVFRGDDSLSAVDKMLDPRYMYIYFPRYL